MALQGARSKRRTRLVSTTIVSRRRGIARGGRIKAQRQSRRKRSCRPRRSGGRGAHRGRFRRRARAPRDGATTLRSRAGAFVSHVAPELHHRHGVSAIRLQSADVKQQELQCDERDEAEREHFGVSANDGNREGAEQHQSRSVARRQPDAESEAHAKLRPAHFATRPDQRGQRVRGSLVAHGTASFEHDLGRSRTKDPRRTGRRAASPRKYRVRRSDAREEAPRRRAPPAAR